MVGLATLLSLIAAMFVALQPTIAQTATYTCVDNGGTLEVHNGTEFVALAATGATAGTVTPNADGDDCSAIDPDGDFGSLELVAGDQVKVDDGTDTSFDGVKDTFAWEAVYVLHLGNAEDEAANEVTLALDNPHNVLKGADRTTVPTDEDTDANDPRPQAIRILAGGNGFTGADPESFTRSDSADQVVLITTNNLTAADGYWNVQAVKSGTTTITVTEFVAAAGDDPAVTTTRVYNFTVGAGDPAPPPTEDPSVTLEIDDSDDTVGNSRTADHGFTITVKNLAVLTAAELEALTVYVSGELDNVTVLAAGEDNSVAEATYTGEVNVPQGTTAGEYTLSIAIEQGDKTYRASDVLTVGDAGDAIGAASLSLGVSAGEKTPLDSTDDAPESGNSVASGAINLNLVITNSLGEPANNDDIEEIIVVAPRASVRYADATGKALGSLATLGDNDRIPETASVNRMLLEISSGDGSPRGVEVYVIVLGATSSQRSETVALTFTGEPDELKIVAVVSTVLAFDADDGVDKTSTASTD
ncbi:MAG: hypothetical protein OXC29_14770, partial [Rhodococcus sp.]|nr:hypothetical protein [Rhodococcus sp. (in: high G+C Gram-positive bacteria)]